MPKKTTLEILSKHLQWRIRFLSALNDFKITQTEKGKQELIEARKELHAVCVKTPETEKPIIEITLRLIDSLIHICDWVGKTLSGEDSSEKHLRAAQGQVIVINELLGSVNHNVFSTAVSDSLNCLNNIGDLSQVTDFIDKLKRISIPILPLEEESVGNLGLARETSEETSETGPFVIKVIFDFEKRPWRMPQLLRANTIYDFNAQVTIKSFPKDCNYLLIDYIATLSPEHYRVTPLRIDKPTSETIREFNVKGHAEFPVAQGFLSEPIDLLVRGTFRSTTNKEIVIPATVVGYHHLSVKVSDPTRNPILSKYRSIDARIAEIIEEINNSVPNLPVEHLTDFTEILGAISNHMGRNLQRPIYKEGMTFSEAEFQTKMLDDLRIQLGEDVQEAPRQGGGPTDIKYKSVITELKVEKIIKSRQRLVEKYVSQPTQYSSASGAQLGITCILDLTEKDNPPAAPQNNIVLVSSSVHGFNDGEEINYPTKIVIVIIDGNLKLPSDYS